MYDTGLNIYTAAYIASSCWLHCTQCSIHNNSHYTTSLANAVGDEHYDISKTCLATNIHKRWAICNICMTFGVKIIEEQKCTFTIDTQQGRQTDAHDNSAMWHNRKHYTDKSTIHYLQPETGDQGTKSRLFLVRLYLYNKHSMPLTYYLSSLSFNTRFTNSNCCKYFPHKDGQS